MVGFRQVSKINQDRRTREEAITDLDKCPKPYKIPHPHPRGGDDNIFGGFRQVSEIAKDRRTRTREEAMILFTFGHLSKSERPHTRTDREDSIPHPHIVRIIEDLAGTR